MWVLNNQNKPSQNEECMSKKFWYIHKMIDLWQDYYSIQYYCNINLICHSHSFPHPFIFIHPPPIF